MYFFDQRNLENREGQMLRRWVRHRKFDRNLYGQIYKLIRVIPFAFGGVIISGNVAVADGSYNFSMFGVNGAVTHASGQSDRPVSVGDIRRER